MTTIKMTQAQYESAIYLVGSFLWDAKQVRFWTHLPSAWIGVR